MAGPLDPLMNPMWPRPPKQFRSQLPTPPPKAPTGDLSSLVPMPSGRVEAPMANDPSQTTLGRFEITSPQERAELQNTRTQFNTGSALNSLREASPFNKPAPFRRSTEELYQQSFRDPGTMAPGAGQMAQNQLKDRVSTEDFARLLGQKEQETIRTAQTGMHPAVQGQAEQAARRASYPAREAGRSNALSSMFGLQREQVRGQANVEAARARRDQAVQAMILRQIGELTTGGYQGEPSEEQQDRMGRRDMMIELLNRSRAGEFNLGDLIGDEELNQYLTDQDTDEFDLGF